ncbi:MULTISPECIES: DUF397 domain-containing protein [Streptomyces]|uniref:DUF397 domain-containing protein n=1 Tax=Streptomyces hyderabadensis TaxID=598549 RepID=A0ABP9IT71_9ACTN|nr:DUF397 domain-containing protein [Streptomyces hyderabadensis]
MIATNSEPHWFKSSFSGGSGTECVECAYVSSGALVRDSKDVDGPVLHVNQTTWLRFIAALRHDGQQSP